jgi:hypothetical protein
MMQSSFVFYIGCDKGLGQYCSGFLPSVMVFKFNLIAVKLVLEDAR